MVSCGSAACPVVVLLHGLFGAAGNLGVLQRGLAAAPPLVALALRNHGGPPHAPPHPPVTTRRTRGDVHGTLAA